MKKIISSISALALLLLCLMGVTGCQQTPEATGIWEDATYATDTTLGEGATILTLVVAAEGKEVTFTVHTDKETVGAALTELGLVEDSDGDGLFTVVNGMTADYNVDQTYWAFYENDAYANQGINDTAIATHVTYKLVRSK